MRLFTIVLLVLVAFAGADVVSGTLYRSAAQDVDDLMESLGVWDGRVKIVRTNGMLVYAVEFPGEYFNVDSDSDIDRMASVFAAVGIVSAGTSWHSDFVVALFEDDTLIMFTQDCRTASNMSAQGYSETTVGTFMINNIIMGYREECASVFNF